MLSVRATPRLSYGGGEPLVTTDKLGDIQIMLDATLEPACSASGQPIAWPSASGGCRVCDGRIAEAAADVLESFSRPMVVCTNCGNKRCPKATWHGNMCTSSNEPGQYTGNPIAAFYEQSQANVGLLLSITRAVEKLHWRQHHNNRPSTCHADGKAWPCPTRRAIAREIKA